MTAGGYDPDFDLDLESHREVTTSAFVDLDAMRQSLPTAQDKPRWEQKRDGGARARRNVWFERERERERERASHSSERNETNDERESHHVPWALDCPATG